MRVRRILNVESGLNDGLATPVVLFAIAATASAGPEHALSEALREIGVGALVGVLAGYLAGRLMECTRSAGWALESLVPIAARPYGLAAGRRGVRHRLAEQTSRLSAC